MRVVVLGAGVIGVSTAYQLAKRGHEVTVVERQPAAGMETSYANGGQISACQSFPWNNPKSPKLIMKWLGREDSPLLFRLKADPAMMMWAARFLANCTSKRAVHNFERVLRLALYSRKVLRATRAETNVNYDFLGKGILQIFRDGKAFEDAVALNELFQKHGLPLRDVTPEECLDIEPALGHGEVKLKGGIFSAKDESGDTHLFTRRLAEYCEKNLGVKFEYDTAIQSIEAGENSIQRVHTDKKSFRAKAYVVCLGSYAPELLRPLKIRLPIYPAKGYSLTLPVTRTPDGKDGAPRVSITDEENRVVFSRLDDRLRVAGMFELDGFNTELRERRTHVVLENAMELFPHGGDPKYAQFWSGLRPMTTDWAPIIGPTPYDNLFLNAGHGALGWTLSAGSAKAVADLISGEEPEVDISDMGFDRY